MKSNTKRKGMLIWLVKITFCMYTKGPTCVQNAQTGADSIISRRKNTNALLFARTAVRDQRRRRRSIEPGVYIRGISTRDRRGQQNSTHMNSHTHKYMYWATVCGEFWPDDAWRGEKEILGQECNTLFCCVSKEHTAL